MIIRDAIALLQQMPEDAVLVGTDGPIQKKAHPASARLGVEVIDPVLSGFSAEELRREEWDFFILEKSNIVILAMTQNSQGQNA